MPLIYLDKNTFQVQVQVDDAGQGFMPTEETIAIKKYAELLKGQLQKFLKEKHEPMVRKLLQMCADYNYKNSVPYRRQMDALTPEQRSAQVVLPTALTSKKPAKKTGRPTKKK